MNQPSAIVREHGALTGTETARQRTAATSPDENTEWLLADFVDAIAAEIDQTKDTLSLKSYGRGMTLAVKQLELDLAVSVRRTTDGRIFFRTMDDTTGTPTILRLEFGQVLQQQLLDVRKPLDQPIDSRPLHTLPTITPEEVAACATIGIFTIDDLERYTQTRALIAEVSRKTGIPDAHIRQWRGLPFLEHIDPAQGSPGAVVQLVGGNFRIQGDPHFVVTFRGVHAHVLDWSDRIIMVEMPQLVGVGTIEVEVNGIATNVLTWEAIGHRD
ncbi:MAG: hypothetical protein M3R24_35750 [Chloroflexota bacterium]|nr:hypothetical protein [Chloroflexota bacterium]